MKPSILYVEDDPTLSFVTKDNLEMQGYSVTHCENGKIAMDVFDQSKFDLCILDVMMPEVDGFDVAAFMRKKNTEIPIIFLTAKSLKDDKLHGLRIGADDYITKPFDSEVLLYKIRAILKRGREIPEKVELPSEFVIGDFSFNYRLRALSIKKQEWKLSPKEAELLRLLAANMNDIVPRQEALRLIWGEDNFFTGRSMDVFIVKLRKYLKDDPKVEIVNIHGNGYRLIDGNRRA